MRFVKQHKNPWRPRQKEDIYSENVQKVDQRERPAPQENQDSFETNLKRDENLGRKTNGISKTSASRPINSFKN